MYQRARGTVRLRLRISRRTIGDFRILTLAVDPSQDYDMAALTTDDPVLRRYKAALEDRMATRLTA
jgi:hypothetical protein